LPLLRVLARLKWLRGSKFDPFGNAADRRLERKLLLSYEALLDRVVAELDESRFDIALQLVRLPEQVRGYGPIKRAAAETAGGEERRLWQEWNAARSAPALVSTRASAA
jgi:indolepyruvate ferredoxin oxidoreductase